MGKSQSLYLRAKDLIPGGTQLLSKRPELFLPKNWPAYYKSASGCKIEDLDGKKYTDMVTMGIGTNILGYADEDINQAVISAVQSGSMTSLNCPEEVKLAELLIELHPWANMARFARTGGEALSIAVRIGRAKSKKDKVLFCGYHGWHDWYLSSNLAEKESLDGHLLPGLQPVGVPRALSGSSIPFHYNDTEEFLMQLNRHKKEVGVIVLETIRNEKPKKEFINVISEASKKNNIVFIVDEVTAGWRLNIGGAHLLFDIEPDLAVFAKGMSNGFPMAAVIGKSSVMDAAQNSFISSTYWTERIGPVAAIATIEKMRKLNVPEHLAETGMMVQNGWVNLAMKNGLKIEVSGIYPLSHFSFLYDNSLELKTLFTQMMLQKKFLASTVFYASYAHKSIDVNEYLKSVDSVFGELSQFISDGTVSEQLKGPICHSGFNRLN